MKLILRTSLILLTLTLSLGVNNAYANSTVAVARFSINGPQNINYLSTAVQDAIVGSLVQRGYQARAINRVIDPNQLTSAKQGGASTTLLVAGRINSVGDLYRVRVKWVDRAGLSHEEYLKVSGINRLLPEVETLAARRLHAPTARVARAPTPPPQAQESAQVIAVEDSIEAQSTPKAKPARQSKVKTERQQRQVIAKEPTLNLRGYDAITQRLPFDVRSLAIGDLNQDGIKELVLTSQHDLYIYQYVGGNLNKLARYPGGKLDYFVKVDILSDSTEGPMIALTNLRGNRASSKLLKFSGSQIIPVAKKIPYQLRVIEHDGTSQLVGATYNGRDLRHSVYRLNYSGGQVTPSGKLNLPHNINLYDFTLVRSETGGGEDVVSINSVGKLQFYEKQNGKYSKVWGSRLAYGGTGNFVPNNVKSMFNEVTSSYYEIPAGVEDLKALDSPEILVVKNESSVKNAIGRVPLISDGRLIRLKWDDMGFVETWSSKTIDGSIQDYAVAEEGGRSKLFAAVQLRNPRYFGASGRKGSVLLIYDL